jgi:hypothetical protein
MKLKRVLPIVAAFACVLLVLALRFVFTDEMERASAKGEILSIRELRSNEELIVSTLFSHRTARGREYRIQSEGERRSVTIFDTTPEWSREDGSASGAVLVMRDLSRAEIEGLEEIFAYFREVREEPSSAISHVRLRHLRDGRQVGQEFYIGFSLTSRLSYYDQEGMRGNPDYAHDYARLAREHHITPARLLRMVPLEALERRPNKAPEPTP